MEVNVHDVIRIEGIESILSENLLPHWAELAIEKNPYVIVRRSHGVNGMIPVGIRGEERSQRFAAFVPEDKVESVIQPEQFVNSELWKEMDGEIYKKIYYIKNVLEKECVQWGIIGSLSYEMLTKIPCVTKDSDVDLIVRYDSSLTHDRCSRIMAELERLDVKVDVQVEWGGKAFSMAEYVCHRQEAILFKTKVGPALEKVEGNIKK